MKITKITIIEILPSYYFRNASVLVTSCGHKHLRFKEHYKIGDIFDCPFCNNKEQFNNEY